MPEYLGYILKGLEREVLDRVEIAAHGTRRLRSTTLESLQIPVPPLPEQQRIVAYLDGVAESVRSLKHRQEETDAELKRLEQSILDRALRGEL